MTSVGDKDIRIEFIGLYRGEITVKGSIVEKQADRPADQSGEGNKAADTGVRDSYAGYVSAALSSYAADECGSSGKDEKKEINPEVI